MLEMFNINDLKLLDEIEADIRHIRSLDHQSRLLDLYVSLVLYRPYIYLFQVIVFGTSSDKDFKIARKDFHRLCFFVETFNQSRLKKYPK